MYASSSALCCLPYVFESKSRPSRSKFGRLVEDEELIGVGTCDRQPRDGLLQEKRPRLLVQDAQVSGENENGRQNHPFSGCPGRIQRKNMSRTQLQRSCRKRGNVKAIKIVCISELEFTCNNLIWEDVVLCRTCTRLMTVAINSCYLYSIRASLSNFCIYICVNF